MKITITRSVSLWPHGHVLQWDVDGASASGVYMFSVYRSGSLQGPWELLAENLTNTYAYRDKFPQPTGTTAPSVVRPNQLGAFRNFYYRVVVTGPTGDKAEVADEVGVTAQNALKGYRRKALRDFMLQLKKFNGTPVALLKRKHWGVRCPKCFDKGTKEVMRSNCIQCWGTGFMGGYWDPIITYARRATGNNVSSISPDQKSDANDTKLWMPDVPCMERDDVIVFLRDQRRYRVDQQSQTEIQLEAVHQVLSIQEYSHDNIIYRYPVSVDDQNPLF